MNVRTAYRDLDFLRDEWRVPLEFDRASLRAVTLSQGKLVALSFAENVLAQYRATPATEWLATRNWGLMWVDEAPNAKASIRSSRAA